MTNLFGEFRENQELIHVLLLTLLGDVSAYQEPSIAAAIATTRRQCASCADFVGNTKKNIGLSLPDRKQNQCRLSKHLEVDEPAMQMQMDRLEGIVKGVVRTENEDQTKVLTAALIVVGTPFRQILKKPLSKTYQLGIPPKSLAQVLQTLEESALQNMKDF